MMKSEQMYGEPGQTFMAPELLNMFLGIIFIKVIDVGSAKLTVLGTRRYWCV